MESLLLNLITMLQVGYLRVLSKLPYLFVSYGAMMILYFVMTPCIPDYLILIDIELTSITVTLNVGMDNIWHDNSMSKFVKLKTVLGLTYHRNTPFQ